MIGLIWFVQVVHYPLFAMVGEASFQRYEEKHTLRTGWVVGPFMLAEAGTATAIALSAPEGLELVAWIALGLLAAIWLMTAFVQVPLHGRLNQGWHAVSQRRLVLTNWGRTVLWTARGPLALVLLLGYL